MRIGALRLALLPVVVLALAAGGSSPGRARAGEQAGAPPPQPKPGTVRALAMDQEVRGLPDKDPDKPVRERMLIDEANNRVLLVLYKGDKGDRKGEGESAKDAAPGKLEVDRRIVLNMSSQPPEVTEIWDGDRLYRRSTRDLNRLQEERDAWEADMIRRLAVTSSFQQGDGFLSGRHAAIFTHPAPASRPRSPGARRSAPPPSPSSARCASASRANSARAPRPRR